MSPFRTNQPSQPITFTILFEISESTRYPNRFQRINIYILLLTYSSSCNVARSRAKHQFLSAARFVDGAAKKLSPPRASNAVFYRLHYRSEVPEALLTLLRSFVKLYVLYCVGNVLATCYAGHVCNKTPWSRALNRP